MTNEQSILCPIKETMVYPSVCTTKCTYTREKCEEAKAKRAERMRYCIDCHGGDQNETCGPCLDEDPRDRPLWDPWKGMRKKPEAPAQMSLF